MPTRKSQVPTIAIFSPHSNYLQGSTSIDAEVEGDGCVCTIASITAVPDANVIKHMLDLHLNISLCDEICLQLEAPLALELLQQI